MGNEANGNASEDMSGLDPTNATNDDMNELDPTNETPLEQESTANATWSRMLAGNRRFAEGKAEHP